MKNKLRFKQESAAKEFAKELKKDYGHEITVEGTNVVIKNSDFEKPSEANLTPSEVWDIVRSNNDRFYEEMEIMYRYVSRVEDEMYEMYYNHIQGHLPKIKDAGKMEEVLEKIGLGNSYEVRKPVISVARKNGRTVYEVE